MAANPARGEVDVTVGSKTYTLRPTMNHLCVLQKRTGKTYGATVSALMESDVEAMRDLLFAFLQPYHAKEFTNLDSVGALIDDIGDTFAVRGLISEVLLANKRRGEATDNANPPKAQAGTGTNSGATPDGSA